MPETTPLIKAALNLRVGAGFDVYRTQDTKQKKSPSWCVMLTLKKNSCKSKFLFFKNRRKLWRCEDRIGFMP